jgi:hypothetical protein
MMLGIVQKRPGDQLDYDVDFARWLTGGDTITSVQAVSSAPGELPISTIQYTGQAVKIWLPIGGVLGKSYDITVTAATAGGRIKETGFEVRIRNY